MRFEDRLLIDDEEMEDFLLSRCPNAEAQVLCDHFLRCTDCNERLEFNRSFLQVMKSGLAPLPQGFSAGAAVAFDPQLYDATAFYLCPESLHWLKDIAVAKDAEIAQAARTLGVFDEAARRTLEVACRTDVTHRQLTEVVEGDPVLASLMIQFANSPLFGAARSIDTLPHAVTFVGVEPTRQLVLGVVVRRSFGKDREQWAHSVAVAQYAEAAAELSGRVDCGAAFLAGLVHDVGRLVLGGLPVRKVSAVRSLHTRGCPLGHAESLLFGRGHCETGASYLKDSRFPDSIVEAVRLHHRPDLAPTLLAKILFLAEHLSGSEEDSTSSQLIAEACTPLGILPEKLEDLRPKPWGLLLLAA